MAVQRSGWSKQGRFEGFRHRGHRALEYLRGAGRPRGIGPGAPATPERVESGLVSVGGGDTDNVTNPFEVRLGKYVDLDVADIVVGIQACCGRSRLKGSGAIGLGENEGWCWRATLPSTGYAARGHPSWRAAHRHNHDELRLVAPDEGQHRFCADSRPRCRLAKRCRCSMTGFVSAKLSLGVTAVCLLSILGPPTCTQHYDAPRT